MPEINNGEIKLNDTDIMAQPVPEEPQESAGVAYTPADVLREQMQTFRENKTITLDSAINSTLSPDETLAWVVRNRQWNDDHYFAKNVWNGVLDMANIIPKMSKAVMDASIASKRAVYEANPDKKQGLLGEISAQEKIAKGLVGVIEAIDSMGYEDVEAHTPWAKFWSAVARNTPQIIAQAATFNYAGAAASMGLMGAQIFSDQYYQLTKEGVDKGKAAAAAFINASVQSALERVGMGSWMTLTRSGSVKNVFKGVARAVAEEGGTEAIQELPEQFTNLWAQHPELDAKGIFSLWQENMGQNVENMVLAGAVGALFGGVGGGFNSINLEMAKAQFQKSNIERLGAAIQQDIKDGIHPMYVGVTSDTNAAMQNIDNKAYVEAKALSGFFKTVSDTDANNLALMMGTTVENVELAAQQGGEIETTVGSVEALGIATKGAGFEAIKNDLTFDLNEKSVNESESYQKMMKSAYALDVQETTELNAEIDKMFEKSALPKEQQAAVKALVARMATSVSQGDNPAEWLRKHPAMVQRVYETVTEVDGYNKKIKGSQVKIKLDALKEKDLNEFNDVIKRSNGELLKYHNEHWENNSASSKRVKAALEEIAAHPVLSKLATSETLQHYLDGEYVATPETLLFTLYVDGSVDGRSQFDLIEWANNKGIGDIGFAEKMLKGLSFNHPEWINYTGTLDLHNISLREDMMPGTLNGYAKTARQNLTSDVAAWKQTISDFMGGKLKNITAPIRVMQTPIAMQIAGAKNIPIKIDISILGKILRNKHKKEMTASIVGQIPGALTDPMLIYRSPDKNGKVVLTSVLSLQDAQGDYVIVPVILEESENGSSYLINKIETAYGKKGIKNGSYLQNNVNGEKNSAYKNLMYINTKKTAAWARSVGLQLPIGLDYSSGSFDESIANENDLVKLKEENLGMYKDSDDQILGNTSWEADGKAIISLFNGSDVSVVMHEVMHYFLEAVNTDVLSGMASEQQVKDLETLLKFAGTTTADFQKMTIDEKRSYHEKIAEAFETYLMERKAPSFEIKTIFDKIKNWMLSIYENRKRNENAIPLTDEVAKVFDSMLATEEALREVEVADGYLASLPKAVVDTLDEKSKDKLRGLLLKVHDKAVDILAKKANESFSEERKSAIQKYKVDILPVVTQQIQSMPLYQAMSMLREFTDIALNGKGNRADVRAIARRYLNQEGKAYANWKEELDDVNGQLDDLILPVVEDLESGMGNGVQIVETPAEMGGGNVCYRVSNNEEWYQNWYAKYGHRPSAEDLRELAVKNLTGTAYQYTTRSMYGLPEDIASNNKTKLDELLRRQKELEEQREKVQLGRRKGLSAEDMTTFAMVAESTGFANGQELAYQILNMPTEKQAINSRVDEYVKMQFPDFWQEKATALEAAREALYNDPHAELIALEQQLMYDALNDTLQKQQSHQAKMQIARSEAEAAKAEAFERIRTMQVREARLPRRFIADERRAAVNAAEAMAAGDVESALKYKHQQLVAHQMVGMSMAFREEHAASIRYVNKIKAKGFFEKGSKKKVGYWHDGKTFYAAAELMTLMGLNVKDYNVREHFGKGDLQNYVNELTEQGWELVIDPDIVSGKINIYQKDNLSVETFQNAIDSLRNFRAVANAIYGVNQDLKAKDWEETRTKVLEELRKLKTVFVPLAGEHNVAKKVDVAQTVVRSTDNLWEMMDGWRYGYFNKTWGAMLKHCADREAKMINRWDEQTKDITLSWAKKMKEQGISVDESFSAPELGKDAAGNAVVIKRHHLIGMLCYLGSQSGMERLCGTPIVGVATSDVWVAPADNTKAARAEAIEATRQNIKQFLEQYVTKDDIEYAQAILNVCDQWWPELEAVNQKTRGFSPDKVMAVPQTYVLRNGEVLTMQGGYCPLRRNGDTGSRPVGAERVYNMDTNEKFQGRGISTMTTDAASSQNRTNAFYPVDISQGWFDINIRDTIHDICYRECMQEFKKLLNDDEIYTMLQSKLGLGATAQLREMLEATAKPYSSYGMNMAENFIAGALNWMRRKTVNAAILWNFKTALQNLSNMYLFGNAVDGFSYADVTAAIFGNFGLGSFSPKGVRMLDAICSKSVFFNERNKIIDFSMRDIVEKSNMSKMEREIMKWGTRVLVLTDNLTAKPIWAAAYAKKINAGATEQEAIDFADTIIRRTLGSSRVQDVSSIQRGGAFLRLFTTFQSFFNTQYNQWVREYHVDRMLWTEGQKKEAMSRVTSFLAAKYLFVCLVSSAMALENPFGFDDKDRDKKFRNISEELMLYPLSMFGLVGQVANVQLQKFLGLRSYGYKLVAAQGAIERYEKMFAAAGRYAGGKTDDLQDLIEPTVGAVTFTLGIPDQIIKLLWNTWDIVMNDMDPEWRDIMYRRLKRER